MNQYKIYSTNDGIHTAIKVGWSWAGFFLVICIYAVIMSVIEISFSNLFINDKQHAIWMFMFGIVGLVFAIIHGRSSNETKEIKFRNNNYYFRATVRDKSEGMAVYNHIIKTDPYRHIAKANKNDNKLKKGGGY